jgi:hypothetical protein
MYLSIPMFEVNKVIIIIIIIITTSIITTIIIIIVSHVYLYEYRISKKCLMIIEIQLRKRKKLNDGEMP